MKEFIILQFKLHKEGKSAIPIESLDILAKKVLTAEEYKEIKVSTGTNK